MNEDTFQGEWSRIVAADREVKRRVRIKVAVHHEREKKIATIREVARQAGERAVELYLADLAESEWMRKRARPPSTQGRATDSLGRGETRLAPGRS
jgi:hypothetical protein